MSNFLTANFAEKSNGSLEGQILSDVDLLEISSDARKGLKNMVKAEYFQRNPSPYKKTKPGPGVISTSQTWIFFERLLAIRLRPVISRAQQKLAC